MTNQRRAPEAPRGTAADGKTELFNVTGYPLMVRAVDFNRLHAENQRLAALVEAQQPAPSAAGAGNSGFDYQTAADLLNGKTVSDEVMRKFVAASCRAHDDRVGLLATLLSVRGEQASREAEIALLKKALMDAEAPQPSPTLQADSQPAPDEAVAMSRTRDLAESGRWPSDWVEAYRRGYSDRAARAPADSQPAHQRGTGYPPLPATYYLAGGVVRTWDEGQMRAYVDADRAERTHALRMEPCRTCNGTHYTTLTAWSGRELCSDCGGSTQAAPQQEAQPNYVVSLVVLKEIPTGFNTQNKLYMVNAASSDEAVSKAVLQMPNDFPEHRLHTVCFVAIPAQPAPAPLSDDVVKDAARYRWLIDQHWIQTEVEWRLISTDQDSTIKQLDAAIDAAIAAQGGK